MLWHSNLVQFGISTPACPQNKQGKCPTAVLPGATRPPSRIKDWAHVIIWEAITTPPAGHSAERLPRSDFSNLLSLLEKRFVTFAWDYSCGEQHKREKNFNKPRIMWHKGIENTTAITFWSTVVAQVILLFTLPKAPSSSFLNKCTKLNIINKHIIKKS